MDPPSPPSQPSNPAWKAALLVLTIVAVWYITKRVVSLKRSTAVPPGVSLDASYRDLGPEAYDDAMTSLRSFARLYASTFELKTCTRETVYALLQRRDDILRNLRELRLRMPNDLFAEQALAQHTEEVDRVLRGYVDDAQTRCDAKLLFTGPIDDMFYRKFYLASNDVTQ